LRVVLVYSAIRAKVALSTQDLKKDARERNPMNLADCKRPPARSPERSAVTCLVITYLATLIVASVTISLLAGGISG
jgi:hypothetical protein